MTVACPDCRSVFRVDPAKVPASGVRARCSVCGGVIPITGGTLPVMVTPASAGVMRGEFATPFEAVPAIAPSGRAHPLAPLSAAAPTPAPAPPSAPALNVRSAALPPGQSRPTPAVAPIAQARTPRPLPPAPVGASPAALPIRPLTPALNAAASPPAPAGAAPAAMPTRVPTPPVSTAAVAPAYPGGQQAVIAHAQTNTTDAAPPAESSRMPGSSRATVSPGRGDVSGAAPSFAPTPSGAGALPVTSAPLPPRKPINPFLKADPGERARRLARALVSDLVAYHPAKREEGIKSGTLRQMFREEIKKSYEEYVDQVGRELAESTPHFQDALNDILSAGRKLF